MLYRRLSKEEIYLTIVYQSIKRRGLKETRSLVERYLYLSYIKT